MRNKIKKGIETIVHAGCMIVAKEFMMILKTYLKEGKHRIKSKRRKIKSSINKYKHLSTNNAKDTSLEI